MNDNRETKKAEKKEYTNIEQTVSIQFIGIIVHNLRTVFTPATKVNFEFKKLKNNRQHHNEI